MRSKDSQNYVIVGVFRSHAAADSAINQLREAGFDIKNLSLVARDTQTHDTADGPHLSGDRIMRLGAAGALWGGVCGLLVDTAFFSVHGIGPLLVAGPIVAAVLGAVESVVLVGGFSAVGASLFRLGVPKERVQIYEDAIRGGKYLLVVLGTAAEVASARELLSRADAESRLLLRFRRPIIVFFHVGAIAASHRRTPRALTGRCPEHQVQFTKSQRSADC
jgi:hypothetical protein